MDNSSVYDIYTGLKLDGGQVEAGRGTEVKRVLEFCMKRAARNRPVARESGTVLGWIHRKDQDW